MGMFITTTAMTDIVNPGIYSCRPNTVPDGTEPPMLLVQVDDSALYQYGEGEREYRVLGEIDAQEYKPVLKEAKTSLRLSTPRQMTTTELAGYSAVFDWAGE